MKSLLLIAKLFPHALPPIVKVEIIAVISKVMGSVGRLNLSDIIIAIDRPVDPLIIPQISPITSLQNDDTLSDFFIKFTAIEAPFTLLVAILLNILMNYVLTTVVAESLLIK